MEILFRHLIKTQKFINVRVINTSKYFTIRNIGLFSNSNLKLQDWFIPIWLFTSHEGGLSSKQLERDLNLKQKGTWFMLKRLRSCSKFENNHVLSGEVEIDETSLGRRTRIVIRIRK